MPFLGLIGHTRIQKVFLRMLEVATVPHALLFVGPEGVGRSTLAQSLARTLLSHTGDLSLHPDFMTLEVLVEEKTGKRKSQISVEQVRDLTRRLGMSSLSGGAKVVFVQEASALSLGAVNALLKSLEEPRGHVHFILRAGSTEELPATLVSRCQIFRFGSVSSVEMVEGLRKMGFSQEDAQTATAQSLGRPGRAIRYVKDSVYQSQITTGINQAVAWLGSSLVSRLGQVMELIPKTETEKEEALVALIDQWDRVCRDLLLRQLSLPALQTVVSNDLDRLAATFSQNEIVAILSRLAEVRDSVSHHVNAHLALEHLALA
jgi:DNA polymerase-3 subunit delta'